MALDQIRLGTPPSAQDGDDARTAFTRANNNFKALDDMGFTGFLSGARNVSNYNDAGAPGRYAALAGTEANKPPNIQYGLIDVIQHNAAYLVQQVVDVLSGRQATRGYSPANGGTWGAWRPVVNTDQLGSAAFRNVTGGRMDSTAGLMLQTGDFGCGGYLETLSVESTLINNVTISGRYYAVTTNGQGSLPVATNGYLDVIGHSANFCIQFYTTVDAQCTYRRYRFNGTWGAWIGLDAIGVNQYWQDVSGSRALGVAYSTTSRPIQLSVVLGPTSGINVVCGVSINGVLVRGSYASGGSSYVPSQTIVIPPFTSYVVNAYNGTAAISSWLELR